MRSTTVRGPPLAPSPLGPSLTLPAPTKPAPPKQDITEGATQGGKGGGGRRRGCLASPCTCALQKLSGLLVHCKPESRHVHLVHERWRCKRFFRTVSCFHVFCSQNGGSSLAACGNSASLFTAHVKNTRSLLQNTIIYGYGNIQASCRTDAAAASRSGRAGKWALIGNYLLSSGIRCS
jgi:hypothetical protein